MPTIFAYLLLPFSLLYGSVMWLRNKAFDLGWLPSVSFGIPVVAVGNIRVGGTGKTPMVDHLAQLLAPRYKLAILSRGYGRSSRGFRWVSEKSLGSQVGDEPLLLKHKHPDVPVAVCERRVDGIRRILAEVPQVDLILLDDAMQHRWVRPSLLIGLSSCTQPFYADLPMPSGMLREFRAGMKRADLLVMTRCTREMDADAILRKTGHPHAYLSSVQYPPPPEGPVFGFSGLANNGVFQDYLREQCDLQGFSEFHDHHHYTQHELDELIRMAGNAQLVCTEKDAVKLSHLKGSDRIFPIAISFQLPEAFDQHVLKHLTP